MANHEHLRIIGRGVAAWNEWRQKNPELRPDLYKANLSKANLIHAELAKMAAETIFSRNPDGFDNTERLERLFNPASTAALNKAAAKDADVCRSQQIHEKFETGQIRELEVDDNTALVSVEGQVDENRIRFDKGEIVRNGAALHIDQGIAVTSHASQAKTVDQVIVSIPVRAFSQANEAQFYDDMTRVSVRSLKEQFSGGSEAWKEQSDAIFRFSTQGDWWGFPFFSLSASRYFGDRKMLCLYWSIGTVVITGPKVLDFYAGFCAHRATCLLADGKDITELKLLLNDRSHPEDEGGSSNV